MKAWKKRGRKRPMLTGTFTNKCDHRRVCCVGESSMGQQRSAEQDPAILERSRGRGVVTTQHRAGRTAAAQLGRGGRRCCSASRCLGAELRRCGGRAGGGEYFYPGGGCLMLAAETGHNVTAGERRVILADEISVTWLLTVS